MRSLAGVTVEVLFESEATDAERRAVADVFAAAGIDAVVKGAYLRRSADLLPGLLEITAAGLRRGSNGPGVQL